MSKYFNEADCQTLEDILRLRRDVRGNRFSDRALSDDTVKRLIDAALHAPSVGFSQPWQFVVIRKDSVKQQVYQSFLKANEIAQKQFDGDKQSRYRQLKLEGILQAPVNLAIFYKPEHSPVLGQNSMLDMGRFSVVCAIQNLWLMARAMNIGVGWVSIVDPQQVKSAVNADADAELIGYLCIGYVSEFLDSPELAQKGWADKKPIEEVVFFDRF
ncbi:MAG: 5,6-dimethylbenzimidazole synthase [Algicola sp.]|nr:5,6-dimethylbenzimidazole synthase [Algicola sp.]